VYILHLIIVGGDSKKTGDPGKEVIMPRRPTGSAQDKKATRKQKPIDAIELLKQDHENVKGLFRQVMTAERGERQPIAQRIFKELEIHRVLEEELFYPALQNQGDTHELESLQEGAEIDGKSVLGQTDDQGDDTFLDDDTFEEDDDTGNGGDIIAAAYEDHQTVKELIRKLRTLDPQTSDFHQHMMELEAIVSDHVAKEEEIFFLEAKIQLDIKTLGEQMIQRKFDLTMAA
jgi:hemerythrin superfamily protein